MPPFAAPRSPAPPPIRNCRYGDSRLAFRAPRRRLEQDYLLFLGGTDTFGKYIPSPYPMLLEGLMGMACVNMGCVNAGVDAFLKDHTVMMAASQAHAVVMQVMGAHNLSNRFYTVHPRRNDRFLQASDQLRALYPEIDFAEYNFTRHLLHDLRSLGAARFEQVVAELRTAWAARMRAFIADIDRPVVLFWFAGHRPGDVASSDPDGQDPLFIDREVLDQMRGVARLVVECCPHGTPAARATDGMVFPAAEARSAENLLGVAAHGQAAASLVGPLRRVLAGTAPPPRAAPEDIAPPPRMALRH